MFLYNGKRFCILCVSTLMSLLFGVDNVSKKHFTTKILFLSLHCNKNCIYFITSFSKSSAYRFIAMVILDLVYPFTSSIGVGLASTAAGSMPLWWFVFLRFTLNRSKPSP